jgi:Fe-S oxidoreductase
VSEISLQIERIIREHKLHLCLECGKCSSCCPRMLAGKNYSPRLMAQKIIANPEDETYIEGSLWECLTCGLCEERCPSGVRFSEFILQARALLAGARGLKGYLAHDGAVHSWMRIMSAPRIKQNRLDWLSPDLKTARSGPLAFFVGCAPYFDAFFETLGVDTLSFARDGIRLLNFFGMEPVVLNEERCCGHDLLFSGDRDNFAALARLNHQAFKDAGVEEVVVACPECYLVWQRWMPQVLGKMDIKVTLLIDLLIRELARGGVDLARLDARVTYQDPCRLGRMAGRFREPRELMGMIPGLKLREMESHGPGSLCCGNSAFINCDAYSKRIQVQRLTEAKRAQADLLVTACPKCMIHLACAMRDPHQPQSLGLQIKGLPSLLADQMGRAAGS